MKRFLGNSCAAGLVALMPLGAAAQCIDAFMTGLDEYEAGVRDSKPQFRTNELLVLCFTPAQSGHVSVFDAPIKGDYQRLYPNALTHPGGEDSAQVSAGEEYCFGTRDTFPMYHPPDEGIGVGKISVILTSREDYQVSGDDYAIPGQVVPKATMNLHLSNHKSGAAACSARDVTFLEYLITE